MNIFLKTKKGKKKELTKESYLVSRKKGYGLQIKHPEISEMHASLKRTPEGHYTIEDLGSTNGTYVNERIINQATPLEHGDKIYFGTVLELEYIVEEESPDDEALRFLNEEK